jgi:hypothetical protein
MTFEKFLTFLGNAGTAIYDALFWPGHYGLMQISTVAPQFAANLSAPGNNTLAVFLLSLIYWFLVIVLATITVRWWRNLARIVTATVRTMASRISLEMGNAKTKLVCRLRQRLPWGKTRPDNETPMVEFDKLDLAVLKSAVAKGPEFALSAPELAEQFDLRPAQVQRSLDKLCKNLMIDIVIGSTDGCDNYRLTDSGTAFVTMCERQQPYLAAPCGTRA